MERSVVLAGVALLLARGGSIEERTGARLHVALSKQHAACLIEIENEQVNEVGPSLPFPFPLILLRMRMQGWFYFICGAPTVMSQPGKKREGVWKWAVGALVAGSVTAAAVAAVMRYRQRRRQQNKDGAFEDSVEEEEEDVLLASQTVVHPVVNVHWLHLNTFFQHLHQPLPSSHQQPAEGDALNADKWSEPVSPRKHSSSSSGSTEAKAHRSYDPSRCVRVVDCSWFLPDQHRDCYAEHKKKRIRGSVFLDVEEVATPTYVELSAEDVAAAAADPHCSAALTSSSLSSSAAAGSAPRFQARRVKLPHMLPSKKRFVAEMNRLGITCTNHVVLYDSR